jgi:hypothetical protein
VSNYGGSLDAPMAFGRCSAAFGTSQRGYRGPVGGRRSLLVNFVYCHPVGHAIEALHYCHGYHRAEPGLRIGLALNANTPTELAALCSYVDVVYPISIDVFDRGYDPASALAAIPAGWDWVAGDPRGQQAQQRAVFPGLARYYDQAADRFAADGSTISTAGAAPPRYLPGCQFRLALPRGAGSKAERLMRDARPGAVANAGPRIAILAAGSGPRSGYPAVRSWRLILAALADRWPDALFCMVGKHRRDGRTTTSFGAAELGELRAALASSCNAVDLPLTDQLAIVAGCDVLISPHTGFGMATLAVGTPWLSIAGNRWQEFYFNGVPFYSVLPDLRRFPAYDAFGPDPAPVDDDGPRSPSMCYERVRDDLAEIVEGAARLIERRWPFETAISDHFSRMWALRAGRTDLIWSIDSVHKAYLPATT